MNLRNKITTALASVAVAGSILAGGLVTAAPAAATTIPLATQQAFYYAVVSDYRAQTGRVALYNRASIGAGGKACYAAIIDKKIPFDRAAWAVAGAQYHGDVALARAVCAQALRYGIRY